MTLTPFTYDVASAHVCLRFQGLAPNNPAPGTYPGVYVFCRGIEAPFPHTNIPVGYIGAQHCDATVSTGNGQLSQISGGPDHGALRMWVTTVNGLPTGSLYFYKGREASSLANCLVQGGRAMQASSSSPVYNPVYGPNSNTLLNQLFSGCGTNLGLSTHGPFF